MSLIVIILVFLFVMSFVNVLLRDQQPICNQLYKISFFITFFLFTIKYYYGADIANYVPMYETIPTPLEIYQNGYDKYGGYFETSYVYLCSIAKYLGVSFWSFTALISCFYFYALYKLFENVKNYKIVALFIIVLLDYNLIFAAYRQCMSVSFFMLAYVAYINKKKFRMFIYLILVALLHKSGFLFSALFIIILLKPLVFTRNYYFISLLLFVLFLVLPVKAIILSIVSKLPLNANVIESLDHHFSNSVPIQIISILYLSIIVVLSLVSTKGEIQKKLNYFIGVFVFMIVVFYENNMVLNRMRSYFLPLAIIYIFNLLCNIENEEEVDVVDWFKGLSKKLIPQTLLTIFTLFAVAQIFSIYTLHTTSESRIYDISTVFQLRNKTEEEIKEERMNRAKIFWRKENNKYILNND